MRACAAPEGRAARTGGGGDPRSVRAQLPHGSEKVQIPIAWSSQGETGSGFIQGFGCALWHLLSQALKSEISSLWKQTESNSFRQMGKSRLP